MGKKVLFSTKWYEMREHMGVLQYAHKYHWDVFSSHHMPESVFKIPDLDGLIVEVGSVDQRRLKLAQQFKSPVVALEDLGDGLDVPRVHTDNHAVGKLAADHFVKRGFTRFMTVSRVGYSYAQDRIKGFHEAIDRLRNAECLDIKLNKHRRPERPKNGKKVPSFIEMVNTLQRPIGIFCVDDDEAAEVIRDLRREGLSIPEEVAIVGVNNDPLLCPFAPVPITSVDPNFEGIGYKAAQLLGHMMRGGKQEPKDYAIKPKGLIVRRSSDIRAVEDIHVAKAIRLIWDHADRWRSMKDVASHVNMPTRTLQWRFKKTMGHSLQDEIIRSRIKRIKAALIHTDKPIQRIAEEMGFSSAQYMIRIFSKETGLSPLKFRRKRAKAN